MMEENNYPDERLSNAIHCEPQIITAALAKAIS